MNTRPILTLVAALTLFVAAPASAQAEGARIGVANVTYIFDNLDERSAVEQQIRADAQQLAGREQQYRTEIQQLQQQLEGLNPQAPEFMEIQERLNEQVMQMQVWGEMQQQRLARREASESFRIYSKMLDTIADVAQDEGYDIVLFQDDSPRPTHQSMQELRAQIQMRQVLYASEDVRISDQVVQRMNTEFQAGD